MAKLITQTTTDIQSVQQLVDSLGADFGQLWHALDGKPKEQAQLTEAWGKVQQLHHITSELDALLAGSQAAVTELARQRDIAVFDARTWKEHGAELARRIIAGHIAVDADIPVTDVIRVLDVLGGKTTTFEEPRLNDLYDSIRELADALFEEQVYEAANEEE